MKNAGIDSQTNGTSSVFFKFQRASTGSATLEYAVLLSFIVVGGLAAYFGVSHNSSQIFGRLASLKNYDASSSYGSMSVDRNARQHPSAVVENRSTTQTVQADSNIPTNRLAIVSCLVIITSILVTGGLLLRRQHRKPKGDPSGDQLASETLQPRAQHKLTEKRQQMRRLFLGKVESSPGFEPQVQHLMSKRLMTITPKKPIAQVIDIMETHRIRHLLVCEKDGQLCGIISDRDLKKSGKGIAEDIMTQGPITISPEMTVGTAITIMLNHSISCLPVIDQGKVIGLLTTTDLILSLQCSLQILSRSDF